MYFTSTLGGKNTRILSKKVRGWGVEGRGGGKKVKVRTYYVTTERGDDGEKKSSNRLKKEKKKKELYKTEYRTNLKFTYMLRTVMKFL